MRAAIPEHDFEAHAGTPWALQMQAIALTRPDRLMPLLTEVIVDCGGWVLSRSASDDGTVSLLFEFERSACVDIYSGIVGAGLELDRSGHLRITELCQCTRSRKESANEIASLELQIRTFPIESSAQASARQGA